MTKQQFEAEILFLYPDDVAPAVAAIVAADVEFKVDPTAIDEHGPTVFGWATGTTELDENALGDWLSALVDPLGGDVVTWCLCALRDARLRLKNMN